MFRKFEKIHRLGKDEVDGILDGLEVIIQEKIDGANTSVWLENGELKFASRNQQITSGFNGFVEYVMGSTTISRLLKDYPNFRLYGEWLVPHTIQYSPESYKQWYMYDIYNATDDAYLHPEEVFNYACNYDIKSPAWYGVFTNPTEKQLKEFVGGSVLGPVGEGVVIKNHDFTNIWGDRCYAKLVRQEFLEDNALVFNSNNKHQEFYEETYIVNKWMNKARLDKICNKLQPEINEKLDMKHIPRITNTAYYDMITEEAWEIAKLNKNISFSKLKDLSMKKAKLLYVESLNV